MSYEVDKDRWVASIVVQKICVFKKRYKTFSEACIAIEDAEMKYLGYSRGEY